MAGEEIRTVGGAGDETAETSYAINEAVYARIEQQVRAEGVLSRVDYAKAAKTLDLVLAGAFGVGAGILSANAALSAEPGLDGIVARSAARGLALLSAPTLTGALVGSFANARMAAESTFLGFLVTGVATSSLAIAQEGFPNATLDLIMATAIGAFAYANLSDMLEDDVAVARAVTAGLVPMPNGDGLGFYLTGIID